MGEQIIIIGAGIIGMLCARALLLAGKRVIVLDRQAVGREASWAGAGILMPLYAWRYPDSVLALAHWSLGQYPTLARELLRDDNMDSEWRRSGLLILPPFEHELAAKWCEKYAITHEFLQKDQIQAIQPGLQLISAEPALWLADVAQIRNPRLLAALRLDIERLGADIRSDTEVNGFQHQAGQLTGLQTTAGELPSDRCIVAAGAWAGALLQATGLDLPIRPIRGQIVLLQAHTGVLQRILLQDGRYAVPRSDGRILLGSTQEDVGFDKGVTDDAGNELRQWLSQCYPALAQYPVEQQWAGLRPGVPEGVPFIGPHPDIAGLYVCAGHFRNGLVTAPASAQLLADLILDRPPLLDPSPYQLRVYPRQPG